MSDFGRNRVPGGPLKADALKNAEGPWYSVSLLNLASLIGNVQLGARHELVGFEDANRTLDEIIGKLNKRAFIPPGVVESALWSANLLNERGEFWDVQGRNFDAFLKALLGQDKFNKIYNTIERK